MNIVSPGGITKITSLTEIADDLITNAKINSSAGIVYTKMAALSTDAAVNTNGSGFLEVGTTTSETELGYINSLSSNAQTQISSKGTGTVKNLYFGAERGAAIGGAAIDCSTSFSLPGSAGSAGIYPLTHIYNAANEQTVYTIPITTNITSIDAAYVALNHASAGADAEYRIMTRVTGSSQGEDYGTSGTIDSATFDVNSGNSNFANNNSWYFFDVSDGFDGLTFGTGNRTMVIRGGLSGHSSGDVYFGGLYLTVS